MKYSFERFKNQMPKNTMSWLFVVLSGVAFYFILQNISYIVDRLLWILSLLTPFIMGFAMAYLLFPLTSFLENKVFLRFWPTHAGLCRKLGVFIGLLVVVLLMLSLLLLVLPQTVDNLTSLINQLPDYANKIIEFINGKLIEYNVDANVMDQFKLNSQSIVSSITQYLVDSVPSLVNFSSQLTSGLANLGIAVVAAIYLLLGREKFKRQVKKVLYAFVKPKTAEHAIDITRLADKTFTGFITAQLTDAIIVGTLCFIGLSILHMPYAALISTLVGAFNIIPFFGPIIGAVPSTLIILIAAPDKVIWLLIFLIVLQQVDGNLINPRLVGDRVGLPPLFVMLAIVIGGGAFGIVGMLTGAPIFAALYVLIEGLVKRRLKEREVPEELLKEESRPLPQKWKFPQLPKWLHKKSKAKRKKEEQ